MLFRRPSELQAFLVANAQLGQSERYRRATKAECYYQSLQYEQLQPWEANVALRQKRPLLTLPLMREAIDNIERFIWGGHRFPEVRVPATSTDEQPAAATEIGPIIDEDQAEALTRFIRALVKAGRLARCAREFSRSACTSSSCAVVLGVRGGYLVNHVELGKHCTPTFDDLRPGRLTELEIKFLHQREQQDGAGGVKSAIYWYRRLITETEDIVFREEIFRPGIEPKWVRDPQLSVVHNLGFCPAVWIRTMPTSADKVDGTPIIDEALYPLLDEVNYTESLKNRTVQYNCDPWTARTGVVASEQVVKSAGRIMDLPREATLEIVESTGSGAQRAAEHLEDLQRRFCDAVSYVKATPELAVGRISGVVLEFLYSPMMALAADLRDDLGEDGFAVLLNLALRMVMVLVERGEDVWVPGVGDAVEVLRKAQRSGMWLDVPLDIQWPPFFDPSVEERQMAVASAVQAKNGGLISAKTGTAALAPLFGVEDVDAEHESIEEDQAAQAEYGPMPGQPAPRQPRPKPSADE